MTFCNKGNKKLEDDDVCTYESVLNEPWHRLLFRKHVHVITANIVYCLVSSHCHSNFTRNFKGT